jgi:hypothetical protein
MFNFFKSPLESAHSTERKLNKEEQEAKKKLEYAETVIGEERAEHRRGSGIEVVAREQRKKAFDEIDNVATKKERLNYYNTVKEEVGKEDSNVLEKMHADALEEDKNRAINQ